MKGEFMTVRREEPVTVTRDGYLPATREEAHEQFDMEGDATSSSEWRRAAIVYAMAEPKQGQRTDLTSPSAGRSNPKVLTSAKTGRVSNPKVSFSELASWGWYGLKSPNSVSFYWNAWRRAIKKCQAKPVELGDPYVEPAMEWSFPKAPDPDRDGKPAKEPDRQVLDLFTAVAVKINEAIGVLLERKEMDAEKAGKLRAAFVRSVDKTANDLWEYLSSPPEQWAEICLRQGRQAERRKDLTVASHKPPLEEHARGVLRHLQGMADLGGVHGLDAKHHHLGREIVRVMRSMGEAMTKMWDQPEPKPRPRPYGIKER